MADGLEIDRLSIEIESTSTNAVKQIDLLINSLEKLGNVNVNVKGLNSLSNSITKISTAVSNLKGGQFSSTIESISNSLKGLNGIDKSVATTINALSRLEKVSSGLNNVDSMSPKLLKLTESLKPLSEVGKINLGSSLNQLRKLGDTVKALDGVDLNKFANQCQRISQAITPLAEKSMHISSIFSRIPYIFKNAGNQLDNYSSKVNKATKSHRGLYSSLSSIIGKYYAFNMAISLVSKSLGSLFEESSQYIENLNLFNVAMGSATESASAFANKVSDAMGIDPSEWMKYQGSLNMMITGFGVASDKAQIMSQNLTQLSYDYSSLMNVDVQTAFEKINSAMSGQIKGLKEFGNNVSVAMVKETGLKYGLEGAVSSWDQNTQAIMRYITIMNNASKVDVFNDMARTINTPANAVRILTQQFTMLKRAIGNIASVLATTVIPYIQAFVQILTKAANFVAKLLGFELPKIDYNGLAGGGTALDDVEDSADNATVAVDKTKDSIKKLKKQLMGFDELNIINKPDDNSKSGNGKGTDSGGGSIGDIELPQYDFLKGLENSANEMLTRMEEKLKYLFKPVSDSWKIYGANVMGSFQYAIEESVRLSKDIASSFDKVWHSEVGLTTMSTLFTIVSNVATAYGLLNQKIAIAWGTNDNGTTIVSNLWQGFNNLFGIVQDVTECIKNIFKDSSFEPIINSVKNLTESFKIFTTTLRKDVKWVLDNVIKPLGVWTINSALPGILNAIAKGIETIGKSHGAVATIIGSFALFKTVGFNGIKKGILDIANSFSFFKKFDVKGLVSGTAKELSGLGTTVKGVFSGISSTLSSLPLAFSNGGLSGALNLIKVGFVEAGGVIKGFATSAGGIVTIITLVATALIKAYTTCENFRDTVNKAFSNVGSLISSVWNGIIKPILSGIGAFLQTVWNGGIKPLWDQISALIVNVTTILLNLWNFISPIISTLVNILGTILTPIFITLGTILGTIANVALGIFTSVLGFINSILSGEVFATIADIAINSFELISTGLEGAWKFISDVWSEVQPFFEGLFNVIETVATVATGIVGSVFTTAWNIIKGVWDVVSPYFSKLWEAIKTVFSVVGTVLGGFFSTAWELVSGAWNVATSFFSNIWDSIVIIFTVAPKWLGDTFSKAWENIKTTWNGVTNFFGDIWKGIKNTFSSVSTWFKDTFSKAWTAVKNVFSTGGKIFDGIKEGILSGLKTVVNGLITGINKVVKIPFDGINSALKSIKKVDILGFKPFSWLGTIGVPQIPQLAKGGIPNVGQVFIANEKGPELVSQIGGKTMVSNNMQMMDMVEGAMARGFAQALNAINQNNGDITINATFTMDKEVIGKQVIKYHNDQVIQRGKSPLNI